MRLIGRIFLIGFCAALLAWGVWSYGLGRADVQLGLFDRAARRMAAQAAPSTPAGPAGFRATVCADTPCLLVEAAGQTYLIGAGEGVAEALASHGQLRADLDAILLTGLSPRDVAGLPTLTAELIRLGRDEALAVYGPPGVERVAAGASALLGLQNPEAIVLAAYTVQPEAGQSDTGVVRSEDGVSVSRIAIGNGAEWIYRITSSGRSLVVGGCAANEADIAASLPATGRAWGVFPASSSRLLDIERMVGPAAQSQAAVDARASPCLVPEAVAGSLAKAGFAGGVLAPLFPAANSPAASRAWRHALTPTPNLTLLVGEPGVTIDLGPPTSAPSAPPAPTPAATPVAELITPPAPVSIPAASSKAPPTPKATASPVTTPTHTPAAIPAAADAGAAPKPKPRAPKPAATPTPTPTPTAAPLLDEPFP